MFILTIDGKEKEGAYAVLDEDGDQVLYIFEEEEFESSKVGSRRRPIETRSASTATRQATQFAGFQMLQKFRKK